jgi:hypothetical protein
VILRYPRTRGLGEQSSSRRDFRPRQQERYVVVYIRAPWSFRISLSCAKTFLLVSRTISKPSRPLAAFCWNRSTVNCSILFLIFCQPPHSAVILACCWNMVRELGAEADGWYTTVSRTESRSDQVMFIEHIVTFFAFGST